MTWIDRLLGRKPEAPAEAPPPAPQAFCSKCGQPMVDGFMVIGHEYDTTTGAPVKRVARGRMCIAFHGKERPAWVSDDEGDGHYPGSEDHDGFPTYSWWGSYNVDLVPDCEPRKTKAAK